jgi:hypothetical protein
MRRLLLTPCLLLFLPAAAGDGEGTALAVGRYQLLAATVETVGMTGPWQTPTLFRIDTATGRTCQFVSVRVGGRTKEGWAEIPEVPMWLSELRQTNAAPGK